MDAAENGHAGEKSPQPWPGQPPKEPVSDIVVDFDGQEDPYNPQNWPFGKKVVTTLLWALTTCWIVFASAIYSAGIGQIIQQFHVNSETAASGVSLMMFGFGLGPMIWAPLSEVYGRKWSALVTYFIAAALTFGTAAAKDMQTILITRFFTGLFGSAPVANTGGVMADIWQPRERGLPMVIYGVTLAGGPAIAPVIGGALCSAELRTGWRWTEYLTGIIMMVQLVVDVFFLDETFAPRLLVGKARRLRQETGNFAMHAMHEERGPSAKDLLYNYLLRPFQMLFTPICLLMTIYSSFVYAILYASLLSFEIEYAQVRHWGPVVSKVPFIALLVGTFIGGAAVTSNTKYYVKRMRENNYKPVPEARLLPMMYGGVTFTGGSFLFAWTYSPNLNYWPSIIGIVLTGFGFFCVFQSALTYLVDTFTRYSASALAANTLLRSMAAGAFPLFIYPMYSKLGVNWGTTVFACISALLIPVPFLFFVWGGRIRRRGEWSKLSAM